jgi:hypothetical protein
MEPGAEYDYIRARYPLLGVRDAIFWVVAIVTVAVASLFRDVDWWLMAAFVASGIGWEVTKARLRRNARAFAETARAVSTPRA